MAPRRGHGDCFKLLARLRIQLDHGFKASPGDDAGVELTKNTGRTTLLIFGANVIRLQKLVASPNPSLRSSVASHAGARAARGPSRTPKVCPADH